MALIGSFCSTAFAVDSVHEKRPVLQVERWTTAKGVPVAFVRTPELPMVDVALIFKAGSAYDGDHPGIAQVVASLLDEGTERHSADQLAQALDNVGAIYGVSVTRDMTSVRLRTLTDLQFLNPALVTFAEMVSESSFTQQTLDRVRQQVLSALKEQAQSPFTLARNAFFAELYSSQPYANPVLGTKESVEKLTREDVLKFYHHFYVAKNALVVMVGNLELEQAKAVSEELTGRLALGEPAAELPKAAPTAASKRRVVDYPSQQTSILFGQVGIQPGDPDYIALLVGNHILGGSGLVSKLFKGVREDHGLAYHVSSFFSPLRLNGPFMVMLQTRNDSAWRALGLAQDIVRSYAESGPSQTDLEAAQKNLIGGFPLSLASNTDILGKVSFLEFYHLPHDFLDEYRDKIRALTPDRVKEAFARHVNPKAFVTVLLGEPKLEGASS